MDIKKVSKVNLEAFLFFCRLKLLNKIIMNFDLKKLIGECSHKILVIWITDCAERIISHFEVINPNDSSPRQAIEAGRSWIKES